MVDFPTPPLPDATTTTCFTPAIGSFLGRPFALRWFTTSSFWKESAPWLTCAFVMFTSYDRTLTCDSGQCCTVGYTPKVRGKIQSPFLPKFPELFKLVVTSTTTIEVKRSGRPPVGVVKKKKCAKKEAGGRPELWTLCCTRSSKHSQKGQAAFSSISWRQGWHKRMEIQNCGGRGFSSGIIHNYTPTFVSRSSPGGATIEHPNHTQPGLCSTVFFSVAQ